MPLNSLRFLLFLVIAFSLYWGGAWCFRAKRCIAQNVVLVLLSCVSYAFWDWRFIVVLALEISVAYILGRRFCLRKSRRELFLAVSFYVGVLGYFKYAGFFVDSLVSLLELIGINADWPTLRIVAPIGISFYTFMCLGYVIDVYMSRTDAQREFIQFAAMMSFFPQIVAGPIGRISHLAPQFAKPRFFDFTFASDGLCLFAFGMAKKMVVADTLGQYVDKVFAAPVCFDSSSCLVASVFFAIQIYCDFSGYTDMARGCARLFGIDLAKNFNLPYQADSFGVFWRRWHISLSTWFRDYVYIPLGGSRAGQFRRIINLWIVFLLSGLWHGAAWTFVAWGALHAFYLSLEVVTSKSSRFSPLRKAGCWKALDVLIVFIGVTFAWIFFRAPNFGTLYAFLRAMVSGFGALPAGRVDGMVQYLTPYCLIALLLLSSFLPFDCSFKTTAGRLLFIVSCAALVVFLGIPFGGEFIYQRF